MKFVEIYKTQNDGSQKTVAVCKLENETAVCEGDEVLVKNLQEGGIYNYLENDDKKLFPKDGIKFLENLKFSFKSGYLNASDIMEK